MTKVSDLARTRGGGLRVLIIRRAIVRIPAETRDLKNEVRCPSNYGLISREKSGK